MSACPHPGCRSVTLTNLLYGRHALNKIVGQTECRFLSCSSHNELWHLKLVRLHVDLAKLCQAAAKLEEGLDAFKHPHVCESNFLDEIKLGGFRQRRHRFRYPEHCADDIM